MYMILNVSIMVINNPFKTAQGSSWRVCSSKTLIRLHIHAVLSESSGEALYRSSNTGPDPLKNCKATKLAFNVGPLSARQRIAI